MDICIYHSNCTDGFGAAWVVRKFFGEIDFYPGVYQTPPPNVTGKDVILVDFSYKRDVLIEMARTAKSIFIIDHHKSAIADLIDLPDNVKTVFDMNHSGAMLTWNYYYPDKDPPRLLLHIEDRDLWRFKIFLTGEVFAWLSSYPYDFIIWDDLMIHNLQSAAQEGAAILRKQKKDIDELLPLMARHCVIGGYIVPVVNLPLTYISDACNLLAEGHLFAACYWDAADGSRVFSLRSKNDGLDVSEIARKYGGGGHKHAAGFTLAEKDLHKIVFHK